MISTHIWLIISCLRYVEKQVPKGKDILLFKIRRDFLGEPVTKTLNSQHKGPGFNPWSRNSIPHVQPRHCMPQLKDLACHKEDERSHVWYLYSRLVEETHKQSNSNNSIECLAWGDSIAPSMLLKNRGESSHPVCCFFLRWPYNMLGPTFWPLSLWCWWFPCKLQHIDTVAPMVLFTVLEVF